jgi:methionine-rich copper-binding protein CopC
MGTSSVCVITSVHLTQITTDSQTVPFTYYLNWVSTGSDMHVVNSGKSSFACEFTDCELINY